MADPASAVAFLPEKDRVLGLGNMATPQIHSAHWKRTQVQTGDGRMVVDWSLPPLSVHLETAPDPLRALLFGV